MQLQQANSTAMSLALAIFGQSSPGMPPGMAIPSPPSLATGQCQLIAVTPVQP